MQSSSSGDTGAKEEKKDSRLNIKKRYTLSDGLNSIKAVLPMQTAQKLDREPGLWNVIRVKNLISCNVKSTNLLVLKHPLDVTHDYLSE